MIGGVSGARLSDAEDRIERLVRRLTRATRRVEEAVQDQTAHLEQCIDRLVNVIDPEYVAPEYSDGGSLEWDSEAESGSWYSDGPGDIAELAVERRHWGKVFNKIN